MRNQEKHAKTILPSVQSKVFYLLIVRVGLHFMYER